MSIIIILVVLQYVYNAVGTPERVTSPSKSILKKSSTNPDLLKEIGKKSQSQPTTPPKGSSPRGSQPAPNGN